MVKLINLSFHPLKAGRRLLPTVARLRGPRLFPSPQGGSETIAHSSSFAWSSIVSIPSRRVGDQLINILALKGKRVSIPSRRVGDWVCVSYQQLDCGSFHPLKAGRRPTNPDSITASNPSFHPLKAGRRRGVLVSVQRDAARFHPLKAGRRHWSAASVTSTPRGFHPLKAGRRPRDFGQFVCPFQRFHPLKAGRRQFVPG